MKNPNREKLLAEIADGLHEVAAREERKRVATRDRLSPPRELALHRVEVALLDSTKKTIAVAPIALALAWIVNEIHQTEDTTDISLAFSAHLQVFEGDGCVERGCGTRTHRVEEAARDDET